MPGLLASPRALRADLRSTLGVVRAAVAARWGPGSCQGPPPYRLHLEESLAWLERAHEACGRTGLSVWWSRRGWHPDPYPETSGYAIPTFLACAERLGDDGLIERALEIGEWERRIQHPDGGVLSSVRDPRTLRVFNTGQVIIGWCALHRSGAAHDGFLEAALRAARWLVSVQEPDGSWLAHTHCGPRTYHLRVAWALLEVAAITGEGRLVEAAERQVTWALRQQAPNGWFASCGFDQDHPNTHVLGYTLEGLLECHALRGRCPGWDLDLLEPLRRTALPLLAAIRSQPVRGRPSLSPDAFDPDWRGDTRSSCLTGAAQLAGAFLRLDALLPGQGLGPGGRAILDAVLRTSDPQATCPGLRGALAGSWPPGGRYLPWRWPNWAVKFLVDALLQAEGAHILASSPPTPA